MASQVMDGFVGRANIFFVFISDGEAVHPTNGIERMLLIKEETTKQGYLFEYASILIGHVSSGPMDSINRYMRGTNALAAEASEITQKFKEMLREKMWLAMSWLKGLVMLMGWEDLRIVLYSNQAKESDWDFSCVQLDEPMHRLFASYGHVNSSLLNH